MSDFDPFELFGSHPTPDDRTIKQNRAEAVQDLALGLIREGKSPTEAFDIATEFYKLAEDRAGEANVESGEDV